MSPTPVTFSSTFVRSNEKNWNAESLKKGITVLCEWFPKDAKEIRAHEHEIIEMTLNDDKVMDDSLLETIFHSTMIDIRPEVTTEFTPCQIACGTFAVDAILFIFGLIGLHAKSNPKVVENVMEKLGQNTLKGLSAQIHNFTEAQGATAKAKALLPIASGIYKAGGFSAAYKAIRSQLSWKDWVKAGVTMAAQFVIWFGSDGAAFIATVALNVLSAEGLLEDGLKVKSTCS